MSSARRHEFETTVLPHLGAAYSLARWLLRHPQDAEDAVQDAMVRAYRSFHGYEGGSARGWLLAIVRNACLSRIERRRAERNVVVLADVVRHGEAMRESAPDPAPLPDAALIAAEDQRRVRAAIAELPVRFREVLVLREYQELSYREIAEIVGAPVGTVMSRLARARERLAASLADQPACDANEGPA